MVSVKLRNRLPGVVVALFIAASCGAEVGSDDYTPANRDAFLTACTLPGEDPRDIRDVCECTYDEIEANMAFDDYVALEEALRVDTLAPLSDEVAGYMAECFIDQVDL